MRDQVEDCLGPPVVPFYPFGGYPYSSHSTGGPSCEGPTQELVLQETNAGL